MQDITANAMNCLMNTKRAGKKDKCSVPSSKLLLDVLNIMERNSYISGYKEKDGEVEITLGSLNSCKAIKPRFYVKKDEFDKYIRRFLPARDFGILIVSTSRGLLTHKEAMEKNIGGSLIAFCF